jgi:hypothetical protein
MSTNPAADVIVGLCGVASAVIGYASATHAEVNRRRDKRAARHAAAKAPESGPPARMPPSSPDPAAVLLEAAGEGAARTLRATGTVDLTVTITNDQEGQPRMPVLPGRERRKERRERRQVRWGDSYTEDEFAAGDVELDQVPNASEPDDAAQVNDEELTDGDYAGEET